jgi:hypothetical protein
MKGQLWRLPDKPLCSCHRHRRRLPPPHQGSGSQAVCHTRRVCTGSHPHSRRQRTCTQRSRHTCRSCKRRHHRTRCPHTSIYGKGEKPKRVPSTKNRSRWYHQTVAYMEYSTCMMVITDMVWTMQAMGITLQSSYPTDASHESVVQSSPSSHREPMLSNVQLPVAPSQESVVHRLESSQITGV